MDVVPFEKSLWEPFRRTRLTDAGARPLDSLPGLIRQVLQEADSLLVISNKKEEAAFLYRALSDSGAACFHLSASMCAAHRRDTLRALYQALEQKPDKSGLCGHAGYGSGRGYFLSAGYPVGGRYG